ncbi:MAG: acyltransferase family protein [Deltaproteobacteria bacterium]|nr:acyltransferase family protein [Deltaproteobacteria bacterium]
MNEENKRTEEKFINEIIATIGGIGEELRDTSSRLLKKSPSDILKGLVRAARDILTLDYFSRGGRKDSIEVEPINIDEFGYNAKYFDMVRGFYEFLFYKYFRTAIKGIKNIPEEGGVIIVANHSGALPLDGIMLRIALLNEHPCSRDIRFLVEDYIYNLPFAGTFMNRIGAVRACKENAERLLKNGKGIAVFPEGIQGISKLYKDRYKVQRFGRGGVIRLAIRSRVPIIPAAIVGAEESYPMFFKIKRFASLFGLPYIPVTYTFPFLGPLGLIPLPSKWMMQFGEPIRFDKLKKEDAEDFALVSSYNESLRMTIQNMVNELVASR